MPHRFRVFQPTGSFNAARGFVGGAAPPPMEEVASARSFNAARGFVGGAATLIRNTKGVEVCFNAARGFVGGAAHKILGNSIKFSKVSMPHAALWVVQQYRFITLFFYI